MGTEIPAPKTTTESSYLYPRWVFTFYGIMGAFFLISGIGRIESLAIRYSDTFLDGWGAVTDWIPVFAAFSFGIGWLTIHAIERASERQKRKMLIFLGIIVLLEVIFPLILFVCTLIRNIIEPRIISDLLSIYQSFAMCGLFCRLGGFHPRNFPFQRRLAERR